jgi:hypothetical protein
MKLASLGLAVLLWYVIAGEMTSEMGLQVSMELQNFPQDLELTGEPVNAVEVRLRASPGIIQRLGPGDVSARIDVAGAGEGERIVHLTADSIRVPFGVRVVKISPSILTLNFERTQQKSVPIRPRLLGRPAPGFEVGDVVSAPAEVLVLGPQSRVRDLESAYTEPVSVAGVRANVVERVHIGLEDPMLRIQGLTQVEVTAHVREMHETRAFPDLPITTRGGDGVVKPALARVVLSGPASALAQVTAADIRPYVDVSVARPGVPAPVAVDVGPGHAGVTVKEVVPAEAIWRAVRPRVTPVGN